MRGRPRKNVIPFDKHESVIIDYRDRGTTIDSIAHQYDVTTYQVRQLLIENDVPLRKRGRKLPEVIAQLPVEWRSNTELSRPLGENE